MMVMQTGVTVAIIEGDHILLTLREDFEVWCMPGGEVEDGEALADAARREAHEETGLEVELTRLVGVYSRIGWHGHHNTLFAARVRGGVLAPDPREVVEARFFPFDALPDHLLFGQRHKIEDAISGVTGVVKTEYIAMPESANLSRAELYALRDQSGLSRREFYLRHMPPLTPDAITVEVSGVEGKQG
jgi:ADP-ribose pyrophosphatase YjhB (NUDIX family)